MRVQNFAAILVLGVAVAAQAESLVRQQTSYYYIAT